jgi:hypothetical protein
LQLIDEATRSGYNTAKKATNMVMLKKGSDSPPHGPEMNCYPLQLRTPAQPAVIPSISRKYELDEPFRFCQRQD